MGRCRCSSVSVGASGLCISCLQDEFLFEITFQIRAFQRAEGNEDCFRRKSCSKGGPECKWSALCRLKAGFTFEEFRNAIRQLQFFEKNPDCMESVRNAVCEENECLFRKVCGTPELKWVLNENANMVYMFA